LFTNAEQSDIDTGRSKKRFTVLSSFGDWFSVI
jgi:hypothetical protein